MWNPSADDKANLALATSLITPVVVAVIQIYGPRLKRLTPAERFQQNVAVRETPLGSGRTRLVYAVRPSYIRERADGKHEARMLGIVEESAQNLSKWASGGAWLSLVNHSAGQDMEKTFRVVGTVPPP